MTEKPPHSIKRIKFFGAKKLTIITHEQVVNNTNTPHMQYSTSHPTSALYAVYTTSNTAVGPPVNTKKCIGQSSRCATVLREFGLTGLEPPGHGDVPGRHYRHHGTRHFHIEGLHHSHIPSKHTFVRNLDMLWNYFCKLKHHINKVMATLSQFFSRRLTTRCCASPAWSRLHSACRCLRSGGPQRSYWSGRTLPFHRHPTTCATNQKQRRLAFFFKGHLRKKMR